jgi:hypothetical protein
VSITEFKNESQLLRDAERQSRAWLEHSPVCTKIVDLDLNLQYMSKAGVKGLCIPDIALYAAKGNGKNYSHVYTD